MLFIWECMVLATMVGVGGLAWAIVLGSIPFGVMVISYLITQLKWKKGK